MGDGLGGQFYYGHFEEEKRRATGSGPGHLGNSLILLAPVYGLWSSSPWMACCGLKLGTKR